MIQGIDSIYPVLVLAVCLGLSYLLFRNRDPFAVSYSVPVPDQCRDDWHGQVLDSPSIKTHGSAIRCYCPATGQFLGLVNPSTPDGIDRAIARAKSAQKSWARTSFAQRRQVLATILQFVLDNQATISKVACLDSGKTSIDAALGEILVTVEKLQWTLRHGERALRAQRRPTNFLMMYKRNEVVWQPRGVLAALVSWNYPFHNFISPAISTLFTGSALVLKASENTAWSTQYFASIVRGALQACGHSPDLIQPIVCWPEIAPHLTAHPDISHLTFIGSRPIAHHVATAAACSLTETCLELGGKDPAIVLDDVANLSTVVSILMRGCFQSAGQNCIGIERVIALPRIYDKLVPELQKRIESLRMGSFQDTDCDVGAMINDSRFDHLENLVSEAVKAGARCLVGGSRLEHPVHPKGHYFSPTLLVDVVPSMRIAQEEVFAPICTVMRAGTIDEALEIANGTPYALGAAVFGTSRRDVEFLTANLQAGMVSVNDFAVFYMVSLPFGGLKGSGFGRFGGKEGLRSLCLQKSICRDRFAWLRTSIPAAVDYPISNLDQGIQLCRGIIQLGYAQGWQRIQGLGKIWQSA